MIARYRNLGVKHKLKLIILFAVMAALIPASVAVITYDQIAARRDMRNDLDVLAEMVGANSTAAVTFGRSRQRPRHCSRGRKSEESTFATAGDSMQRTVNRLQAIGGRPIRTPLCPFFDPA